MRCDISASVPLVLGLAKGHIMTVCLLLRMKKKLEMRRMNVVRVHLFFFSFEYKDIYYPCALVDWFKRVRYNPISRLRVVHLDIMHGR